MKPSFYFIISAAALALSLVLKRWTQGITDDPFLTMRQIR